jgi:predicted nucleic acid-binding protein
VTHALLALDVVRKTPRRLPLVDALIAAAALSRDATLVHRDEHMRALPENRPPQIDLQI